MRNLYPNLWQGDISDLNILKTPNGRALGFTLAVNVGSTNFLPPDVFAVHLPLKDVGERMANDWRKVAEVVLLIVREIGHGGKVLITCDAGVSRSIVVAGMVIATLRGVPMDEDLKESVRAADGLMAKKLWDYGSDVVEGIRRANSVAP